MTAQEFLMKALEDLGPEDLGEEKLVTYTPGNDDTEVMERRISVPLGSGALEITWNEFQVGDEWRIYRGKSGYEGFEVAARDWDRTHGLSAEHIEATCYSQEIAAVVLRKMWEIAEADYAKMEAAMRSAYSEDES